MFKLFKREDDFLDYKNLRFNNLFFDSKKEFKINDLDLELLDPSNSDKIIFEIYFNIFKKNDELFFKDHGISSNLFILKPGKIGREFNKSPSILVENKELLFQVFNGEGYFLLQSLIDEDIKIIKIEKNSLIVVPKNFTFILINSSKSENLVLLNLKNLNSEFSFFPLKNKSGAIFYLTYNGFQKNLNFSPMYNLEEYEINYLNDYSFKNDIYNEFLLLPEKFNFLKN